MAQYPPGGPPSSQGPYGPAPGFPAPAALAAAPPPDPKAQAEADEEKHEKRMLIVDIVAALVLGAGTVVTTIAAWQGDLWGGQALLTSQEALALNNEANTEFMIGAQAAMLDGTMFMEALVQQKLGQAQTDQARIDLGLYIADKLMNPEIRMASEWAVVSNSTPFLFPGFEEGTPEHKVLLKVAPAYDGKDIPSYMAIRFGGAEKKSKEAKELYEQALEEDERGDDFMYTTLFYTVGLFFAGLAAAMPRLFIKVTMVALGTIVIIYGLTQMTGLEFM